MDLQQQLQQQQQREAEAEAAAEAARAVAALEHAADFAVAALQNMRIMNRQLAV